MISLSMANVTSTLASVFRGDLASWSKLADSHRFSELRSNFWGNQIEHEAEQWRESHPAMENDHTNDIGASCYGLDLGIDIKYSKLWVREDYIRLYDYCSEWYEEHPHSPEQLAPAVVITGQPGVGVFLSSVTSCAFSNNPSREGKSCWVSYAVRRSLGDRRPFLWYRNGICFVFVEDGVYQQHVAEKFSANDFVPLLWTFVDADACPAGVPEKLAGSDANLFIMFTTAPKRERWKTLMKCKSCMVIIMNPWFWGEMEQA